MPLLTGPPRQTRNGVPVAITVTGSDILWGNLNDAGTDVSTSWDAGTGKNLDGVADWDLAPV